MTRERIRHMQRAFGVMTVFAALATLVASAAAAEHASGVTITSLPPYVMQGDREHLNAKVAGRTEGCSLTVKYANGRKQLLGRKPVLTHRVAWSWQVPQRAALGAAHARVSCREAGARVGTFTVRHRPVRASLAVVNSGFTQAPDALNPSGTLISYGLVLLNRSPDEDALDVAINVTLLDAAGNAVGVFHQFILGRIAAGTTFYTGNLIGTNDSTVITRLAFNVFADTAPRSPETPPAVTNLHLSASYDGSIVVDGNITNEATLTLSTATEIDTAYFNQAGQIVGGASTPLLGLALPPGAQTPFEIDTSGTPQASVVSQAKVSVAPEYGNH